MGDPRAGGGIEARMSKREGPSHGRAGPQRLTCGLCAALSGRVRFPVEVAWRSAPPGARRCDRLRSEAGGGITDRPPRRSFHPPRAASAGPPGSVSPLDYFKTRLELGDLPLSSSTRSARRSLTGSASRPARNASRSSRRYPNASATDPDCGQFAAVDPVAHGLAGDLEGFGNLSDGQKLIWHALRLTESN